MVNAYYPNLQIQKKNYLIELSIFSNLNNLIKLKWEAHALVMMMYLSNIIKILQKTLNNMSNMVTNKSIDYMKLKRK